MCSKVYLLVLFISALSTLSLGEDLYPKLSRHIRSASKQRVGQISAKKCEEYSKIVKNNECTHYNGDYEPHYDYDAKPGEFPHMVLLNGKGDDKVLCAGSLISEKFVLSAANCVTGLNRMFNGTIWTRIGENDVKPSTKTSQAIRLKVIKSYIHPEYNASSRENDISLLELEKNVQFDQIKRPACLNTEKEIVGPIFASGWGIRDSRLAGMPSTLQKTVLEFEKERDNVLEVDPESPMYIVTRPKVGKKDACLGDSGAPVMTNMKNYPCMYNIVGIVSFGRKCAVDPSASTRVSNYIPWIESIVWPEEL